MTEKVQRLSDDDWVILIDSIKSKACTPFLGPGVKVKGFEQRGQIAKDLAARYQYPMDDSSDLARVGRFLSAKFTANFARGRLMAEYAKLPKVTLGDDPNDPHVLLASLPISVYVTTNHDTLMLEALKAADKDAHQELCKWKTDITDEGSFLSEGTNKPSPAQPVVCHLYGYPQGDDRTPNLDSLVFTEDDYFEFLINVSADDDTIPLFVRRAMAGTSLLLLGYRMEDIHFRVLFHLLLAKFLPLSPKRPHVAVQVPVDEATPEEQRGKVQEFLDRYIKSKLLNIKVYWGTSQEFAAELKERWENSNE